MSPSTRAPKPRPRPKNRDRDKGKGRLEGWTQNALISGVVSAIVAGLIAYFIGHAQSQDAARQAQSAHQTQEAGQLENVASVLYQVSTNIYNFQLKCAGANLSWRQCASISPDFNSYSAATTAFGPASFNVTDQKASSLATSFDSAVSKVINAGSVSAAKSDWLTMLNLYTDLEARCAQLIKGQ